MERIHCTVDWEHQNSANLVGNVGEFNTQPSIRHDADRNPAAKVGCDYTRDAFLYYRSVAVTYNPTSSCSHRKFLRRRK